MRRVPHPPGTRVVAALDSGRKVGCVERITSSGTYVRFDDGTARNVAWWRLSREEKQ